MICWMDQKSFTRLTLTPDYRTTSEIQRAQGLLEEVLPTIPDAELLYGVFDNENLLFDRFVRVFVLRPPSGEVQQRQKLGERSLAGYAGHRRFFDYPNGKRITY